MPSAGGWTEAPSGGHEAAPRALRPPAARAERGPFSPQSSGIGAGAGAGDQPMSGPAQRNVCSYDGGGGWRRVKPPRAPGDSAEWQHPHDEKGQHPARASAAAGDSPRGEVWLAQPKV